MKDIVTWLLVAGGIVHMLFQINNRVLSLLHDGPVKIVAVAGSIAAGVAALVALVVFWNDPVVGQALNWRPADDSSRLLFAAFGLMWVFALWRLGVWTLDLAIPHRSRALLRSQVIVPAIDRPPQTESIVFLRPWETTFDLEVSEHDLAIPGLGAGFNGLTIGVFTDAHFQTRRQWGTYFREVAAVVRESPPDILVFAGDFVSESRFAAPSLRYHATMRGRLATLAVLGNHDYWTDAPLMRRMMRESGIRHLHGRRWSLEREGYRLSFVGSDEPWARGRVDWQRFLPPEPNEAVVVVTHTPDNAEAASRRGAALVLCGHTHGGQVCLPLVGPPRMPCRLGHRYVAGLYDLPGGGVLALSRGIGAGGVMAGRILCRPEYMRLRLWRGSTEIAVPARERALERIGAAAPT